MKNNKNIVIFTVIILVLIGFFGYREYNLNKLEERGTESQAPSNSQNEDAGVVCTLEYDPVCGEDNNTYSNSCVAEQQNNVKVKYKGLCGTGDEENNESAIGTGSENNEIGNNQASSGILNENMLTGSSLTGVLDQSGSMDGEKVLNYFNANFNYGFSVPYNSYYSGFGSRDGANHTVAINSGTGVVDFESSQVKVYFYKDKILDELLLSSYYGRFQKDNKTYLQLGNNSVLIENSLNGDKIIEMIIKTIYVR